MIGDQLWKASITSSWTEPYTTELYATTRFGVNVGNIAVSPDRRFVAFTIVEFRAPSFQHADHSALRIMRSDGTEIRTLVEVDDSKQWEGAIGSLLWSPDSTMIAYTHFIGTGGGAGSSDLNLLDVKTGQSRLLLTETGAFDWSPDSKRIAHSGRKDWHSVYVFDLDSGIDKLVWQDDTVNFGRPAWRPGGQELAVATSSVGVARTAHTIDALYLVNVQKGERRELVKGTISDAYWSPDGKQIVYLAYADPEDSRTRRPWLLDIAGGTPLQLLDRSVGLATPAWKGNAILFAMSEETRGKVGLYVMAVADRSMARLAVADADWGPISSPAW
jgi:Tol biopolymer transport system component